MKFKFYIPYIFSGLLAFSACQTNSDNIATAELETGAAFTSEKEDFTLERKALNKTTWFTEAYHQYQPVTTAVNELGKQKDKLSFIVFGGSWCSDTKKALPKFYKVVETAHIPANKIVLYGVDHEKHSLDKPKLGKTASEKYHIDRVPEFIVFYEGKEIGRLNEKPQKTLEEDMLALLAQSKK